MDKEAAEAQNQPDDEGWVTVGRSGRNPAAPRLDPAELEEKRKMPREHYITQLLPKSTTVAIMQITC